jgi:hypothetical protein
MIIESNDDSIFSGHSSRNDFRTITLDRVSPDFIHGFNTFCMIYAHNSHPVKILHTDIVLDSNKIVFNQIMLATECWTLNSKSNNIAISKLFYDKHDIKITKRYSAIIHTILNDSNCSTTVIHFDSTQFLDGLITYWAWFTDNENVIWGIFDDLRSYTLNVEYQLPIINKKCLVKEILNILLLPDMSNIIWEYIVDKCKKYNDVIKCVTEIDIINVIKLNDYYCEYHIYNEYSNSVDKSYSSQTYFECANCRVSTNVEPFKCKVTLV